MYKKINYTFKNTSLCFHILFFILFFSLYIPTCNTLNPLLLIKEKAFSPFIPFYQLKRITNPSRHLHQFTLLKLLMSNTNAICILIYFTDLLFPQFSLTTFPALNFHPIPTLLQNAFFLGQGSSPSTAFVTINIFFCTSSFQQILK